MSTSLSPVEPANDDDARGEPPPDLNRVPASAFVAVRASRPALVVRIRSGMPLKHGLMLTLAASLMVVGGIYSHKRPMHRAIVIPAPSSHGSVVT